MKGCSRRNSDEGHVEGPVVTMRGLDEGLLPKEQRRGPGARSDREALDASMKGCSRRNSDLVHVWPAERDVEASMKGCSRRNSDKSPTTTVAAASSGPR